MASVCTVCHKSKVPNNFLIKCISCFNFWHHRCHLPAIPDPELIAIIRAFNDARARDPGAALNWKCGACRKVKARTVGPAPRSASTKDDPIVIDDDDEVVEIIPAPVKRQEPSTSQKKSTSAKVAQPVRIIDDPIDFLVSPQRASSNTNTLAFGIGQLSVSEGHQGVKEPAQNDISERTPPPLSTNPELHSRRTSTSSHLPEYPRAESKTPENQETTLPSPRARPQSDQPSSPTVPSALAPPSLNNLEGSTIKERSFLERWSTVTVHLPRSDQAHAAPSRDPAPLFHPALLPHYINSQYRNNTTEGHSDKKPDAWYLAALGKSKVKDARSAQEQSTGASDPSRRSRKSRALHYEANRETEHPPNANAQQGSKVPFYFSVNTWMKKNEDALTSFEAIA